MNIRVAIFARVLISETQLASIKAYNELTEAYRKEPPSGAWWEDLAAVEKEIRLFAPHLIALDDHDFPEIKINKFNSVTWAEIPLEVQSFEEDQGDEVTFPVDKLPKNTVSIVIKEEAPL